MPYNRANHVGVEQLAAQCAVNAPSSDIGGSNPSTCTMQLGNKLQAQIHVRITFTTTLSNNTDSNVHLPRDMMDGG